MILKIDVIKSLKHSNQTPFLTVKEIRDDQQVSKHKNLIIA